MSACTFRPPWPFEMARFADLIGTERPANGWMRPRVWETPAPHRFAGAAWCSPTESGEADATVEVRVMLRPKYQSPAIASELLRQLFAEIREAGFARARLVLPERDAWAPVLQPFGLSWTACDELWALDGVAMRERMQTNAARCARRLPTGWHARAVAESDWDFIQTQSGATEFLLGPNLDRVRRDMDAAVSSVVETPSGLVGVLLATRVGMTVALEFLGTATKHRTIASWGTHFALMHLCRRDPVAQFDRLVFTTNPARSSAARNMGRRFQGKLVQSYHHFSGMLQDPI